MELYSVLKLVHIVSSTLLFGTAFGAAFQLWYANRTGNPRAIAFAASVVVLVDWLFVMPAVILQPLTGLWMLELSGQELRQPWLLTAMAIFAGAGLFWFPLIPLQVRMRNLARRAVQRDTELPDVYRRYTYWWTLLNAIVFLAALSIFTLMVLRPQLW